RDAGEPASRPRLRARRHHQQEEEAEGAGVAGSAVRRTLRRGLAWLAAIGCTLLLLEGATRLAAKAGWITATLPPGQDFWWSGHPELGIWRWPNARFEHRGDCFDVVYETNSIGAR